MSPTGGMTCVCYSLIASIEKKIPVTGFSIDFLEGELSSQLNGLLTGDGVHSMLEGKDYQCVDVEFPPICVYGNMAPEYNEHAELTGANMMCSKLLLDLYSSCSKRNTAFKAWMPSLKKKRERIEGHNDPFVKRPL